MHFRFRCYRTPLPEKSDTSNPAAFTSRASACVRDPALTAQQARGHQGFSSLWGSPLEEWRPVLAARAAVGHPGLGTAGRCGSDVARAPVPDSPIRRRELRALGRDILVGGGGRFWASALNTPTSGGVRAQGRLVEGLVSWRGVLARGFGAVDRRVPGLKARCHLSQVGAGVSAKLGVVSTCRSDLGSGRGADYRGGVHGHLPSLKQPGDGIHRPNASAFRPSVALI